jgi:hypothetical protein
MGTTGSSVSLVQLHGAGMTLWCLMLVLQAYLIRSNRRRLHRLIGRSSLVLVPIIVTLQVLVVHHAARTGAPFLDSQGALTDFGAVFVALVLGIAPLFAGLYVLAIYWRRHPAIHGRLMVATTIPIVPPATDRIVNTYFPELLNYLPAVHKSDALATFIMVDILLMALSVWDWRSRPRRVVFPSVLLVMLAYQIFAFNAYRVPLWRSFGEWFLGL